MPTPYTITVGNSGKDYTSLQGATADTHVVNRVANDEIITIECYNTNNLSIDANAASISAGAEANNVTIIPAPGEDYAANDYTSKALKYDPADGVAFEASGVFTSGLVLSGASYTQVTNIQFDSGSAHNGSVIHGDDGNSNFDGCIIQSDLGNRQSRANYTNCLIIRYGNLAQDGMYLSFSDVNQCTFVCPEDLVSTGAGIGLHASPDLNEVAVFGFQAATAGGAGTSDFNGTDNASIPGTTTLTSLTYADQFEDTNNATQDWRMKTGNDLDGAGAGGIDIGYRIPDAIPGGGGSTSSNDEFYITLLSGAAV